MRVCHFTCAHEATDTRVFQKECVSLAKAGYDVYLVAPNAISEDKEGVHVVGMSVSNRHPVYRLLYSSKLIYRKALEIDADVYHFHDIELFSYGVKLKQKGKKVIFDSHENWIGYIDTITWLPLLVKKYMSWTIRRMYRKHLSEFDAVITVSPHIVDLLKQYSSKVYLVTNFPIIQTSEICITDKDEFVSRKNRICYAGTVYKESNQESILKAINEIDDVQYMIVGMLNEEYKKQLSSYSGWDKVSFINRVPYRELFDIYNCSLAGLAIFDYAPNLGYKKGSLGVNKIFEYMMNGLPIICSDQDIWKIQIVNKYQCGICVQPGNIEEIKNAILKILNDKEEAFKMGENGRRAILKEFNWSTQEAILIDIYSRLL